MVPGLPMIGRRFCSLCSRRIQTAQQQRPRDQLTTARKQLVLALRDAAGEHRPAHLPKHNGAGTASMRCPISLLIGRPTFLWSRGGPELKPFFFSFGRQAPDLQLQPPHPPSPLLTTTGRSTERNPAEKSKSDQNVQPERVRRLAHRRRRLDPGTTSAGDPFAYPVKQANKI